MLKVSEGTVLKEFLRNEMLGATPSDPDGHLYRQLSQQGEPVRQQSPDVYRSLRLRRRRALWAEIPRETQWWSVALEVADLHDVRLFSRGKLTGSAGAQLTLKEFSDWVRRGPVSDHWGEIAKIHQLADRFLQQEQQTAILLVGTSENSLTVLDGNHRLVAALLAAPDLIPARFQFFCGLSPQMSRCLWHNNTQMNFYRYAWRRFKFLFTATSCSQAV